MEEDFKDNYSSHSIDFIQRRPNQNLEVIEEENNSMNHDLNNQEATESRTQANFYYNYTPLTGGNLFGKRNKSTEKMKRSALLHEKVKEILSYRKNLNNLEPDDDEEIKIEESEQKKKKVEKKVNRNKKLLNLIKERMNKNDPNEVQVGEIKKEEIKEKEEEKVNENKIAEDKIDYINETPKNDENNRRNKYKKREGVVTFNKEKKDIDENSESKNNENERKEKLLKLFDNQRFNTFRKRDIEKGKKEETKENNENNENESGNKSINSINKNSGSVSYPTFMKKGSGTFQISTPKSKLSHKNEESGKDLNEEPKKESTNKKEEKFTEIPSEQRNKLTINIKPKNINLMNESPNNSSSRMSNKDEISNQKMKNINDLQNKENNDKDKNIKLNIYNIIENNEEIKTNDLSDKKKIKNEEINNNSVVKEEEKFKTSKKEKHKNNMNNSNNSSNNKIKSNNASSKKGALKILELLKVKKLEQRDSLLRAKSEDKPLNNNNNNNYNNNDNNNNNKNEYNEEGEDEKIIDNQKLKEIDSSYIFNQRKTDGERQRSARNNGEARLDTSSLPKKIFRDEEDEDENNYNYHESHNKTQQHFRSNKKSSHNKNKNNNKNINKNDNININMNIHVNKKKNYIMNINKDMNMENFLDFNDGNNNPNRKTEIYINNANSLRNRYNKKMKGFSTVKENIENIPLRKNYTQKIMDNSFDISQNKNSPLSNRILNNNNYKSINVNSSVYEPKRISNNNSPMRFTPYQKNSGKTNINSMKNIRDEINNRGRVYNKVNTNSKTNTTYIKKSPGRFKQIETNPNNTNFNFKKNPNERRNIILNNINNVNINNNKIKNKNNNNNNLNYNAFNNINTNTNNNLNTNNNVNNIGTLEVSSIYGVNSSKDTYNTIDYINNNYNDIFGTNNKKNTNLNNTKNNIIDNSKTENSMLFNLEDLMVLEERLNDIIFALQTTKNIDKKCFNFWNYYYNCSLYKILEKIFVNEEDSNIIRLSINYELMSIMVCYEFSYQLDIANDDICLLLLELIYLDHDNLMIICEYILTKISSENKDNIWVLKLQELVSNFKMSQIKELQNNYSSSPINKITNKTNLLRQNINNILLTYSTEFSHLLNNFFMSLESKSYEEINDFFRLNILRVNNFEGSIMASSYLKKNKYFEPIPAPYIKEPCNKPYTLVLDLDETLVNFKIKSSKEGTLRARPFLFGFLEEMGHYYELIVWTSATEAYANTLIDAIEFEKTYFDYVFFREHAIIIGDDFVKDLTRIGRRLDRVIIVDDMPQNFRLQRQNGITIKPFLGDDVNDMALYDLLPILKHIAEEGNDVRVGLAKYRDEIVKKITSNISKNI